MASGAQSAIWRDGVEPITTVGTEDIIEFNSGAVVNSNGEIVSTRFIMNSGIAVNENPGNAVDPLQDTGFIGLTAIITGHIINPQGDESAAHKLKAWMLEDKRVITTFPKGRFGLRLNDFPTFNLTPNTSRGYMLHNVEFVRDGETKGKLGFIITLRFNGTEGTPTGGQYIW
jgi:hypothetical protein